MEGLSIRSADRGSEVIINRLDRRARAVGFDFCILAQSHLGIYVFHLAIDFSSFVFWYVFHLDIDFCILAHIAFGYKFHLAIRH